MKRRREILKKQEMSEDDMMKIRKFKRTKRNLEKVNSEIEKLSPVIRTFEEIPITGAYVTFSS
jgi:predicted translin family RNA/ssDNA-binding protein